jgi:uncharacterized protein YndB with AHSA1/START domain
VLARLRSPVEVQAAVARPRHEVFRTIADPSTYPGWLLGAQRIRHVDRSFPAPSARFDHSVGPTPAATVDDSSEVLRADPPERLDLLVHVGPVAGEVTFLLDESSQGTLVTLRERPTGAAAALTPLVRPLLYARNRWSLHRLRRRLEVRPTSGGAATLG